MNKTIINYCYSRICQFQHYVKHSSQQMFFGVSSVYVHMYMYIM